MKRALITGITGQDGAYLTHFLIEKGYEVHGLKRRTSAINISRMHLLSPLQKINPKCLIIHYGDLSDAGQMIQIIQQIQPDEVYNLAAMSHVQVSFEQPTYTAEINGIGTLHLLNAIKILGLERKTRFYQASTSELFGNSSKAPQSEITPFFPTSPYAISKLFAHWTTINYRNAYQIFACNGILFNHESPIRGEQFVTRKISLSVASIALGLQESLILGNLNAQRDWGHAEDYVKAMWLMMQQNSPSDFVIATGISTSVREFVCKSFEIIGVKLYFEGTGMEEKGYCLSSENFHYPIQKNRLLLSVEPQFFRPTDIERLIGDASKARNILQWSPQRNIDSLIREMVETDLNHLLKSTKNLNKKYG
ncbi:MAG: GDP-mannose 4,6-dehydratase [Bacteroidetes bacterium]|nr:GDP-mannose 4,6-dehydratase [Bacteroidota bacterium]